MKWIVYCTVCLVNGKIYIGVHKTENPNVWDGYIGGGHYVGESLPNPNTAYEYALKKHGYKNFRQHVLFIFEDEDSAYKMEENIVTLDFIKRRDTYNTKIGGKNGEYYDYIYQYDLSGNFIKEHLGMTIVAEEIGCCIHSLRAAYQQKRELKGFYWSKEKKDKLDLSEYRELKYKVIYQFDLNGNLIKEWENIKSICSELNITKSNILSSLNKKTQAKGYYFLRDKSKIFDILKSKEIYNIVSKHPGKKMKIGQYDLSGNLIKIWDSISECAKQFSKCRDCAKGIRTQTKGFTFKYIQ